MEYYLTSHPDYQQFTSDFTTVRSVLLVTQKYQLSSNHAFNPDLPRTLLSSLSARCSDLSRNPPDVSQWQESPGPSSRRQYHRKHSTAQLHQITISYVLTLSSRKVRRRLLLQQLLPPIPPNLPHLRRRQSRLRRHREKRHHVRQRQRGPPGLGH
jgi:hypothetical protein